MQFQVGDKARLKVNSGKTLAWSILTVKEITSFGHIVTHEVTDRDVCDRQWEFGVEELELLQVPGKFKAGDKLRINFTSDRFQKGDVVTVRQVLEDNLLTLEEDSRIIGWHRWRYHEGYFDLVASEVAPETASTQPADGLRERAVEWLRVELEASMSDQSGEDEVHDAYVKGIIDTAQFMLEEVFGLKPTTNVTVTVAPLAQAD